MSDDLLSDDLLDVTPRQVAGGGLVYEGLDYAAVPGFRPLLLDLHLPPVAAAGAGPVPLVVWVHGGGFRYGDRRRPPETLAPGALWAALTGAGIAVATVDYRLSGEARFPAQLADVTAAVEFLRRNSAALGLDAGRVALWGESAGGTLAALAGFAEPDAFAALVLWYPITDLLARRPDRADSAEGRLLGGRPLDLPELAAQGSPVARVPAAGAPPVLLLHGTADAVVPSTHSERLHELLVAAGGRTELRLVPGADHIFEGYGQVPALLAESVAFLARELGR
ncbi:alpha/beta hydrolase [Kitasatospora sp. NBC_01287]|uniref:alpha/beta hydrolase n=1 Tax=Kitasatospora sp. NBC_01287 TaxID=2903573 RepID=UPI002250FF5B|nr:alpha/beta hydrolase [Kitasatospora sp. NBC_01287]MCX4750146.1 alpha/beta hydrolase [Kitasatospora sp. NBC_01287]